MTPSLPFTHAAPLLVAPIVSTQWLADHLGSEDLIVLDATVPVVPGHDGLGTFVSGHDQYLVSGHIPGAVFAELLDVFSDPAGRFPFSRPSAEQFEKASSSVGVSNGTTVVVYDNAVGQWAARVWWLFRSFGYDQVAVLDGGLTKWNLEERPLQLGHVEPEAGSFEATARPESWIDKAGVERIVNGTDQGSLICGVPPREFTGEAGTRRERRGHIPGSFSVPAARLVDRDSRAFLPVAELRKTFDPALGASDRVVVYCAGGIAAAADALALTLIGQTNVAIYDESLNEWAADPEAPLESAA